MSSNLANGSARVHGIGLNGLRKTPLGGPRVQINHFGVKVIYGDGSIEYYRHRWLCQAKAKDLKAIFARLGLKIRRSPFRLSGEHGNTLQIVGIRVDLHVQYRHKSRSVRTDCVCLRQINTGGNYWKVTPLS